MSFDLRSTQPEVRDHFIKAVGGATAITKVHGVGVTVSRTGAGAYLLTWSSSPGVFLQHDYSFTATTPADLKGFTAVFGVYNSTARTLAFVTYDSTFAAADLAALQWINIRVTFKQTGI